MIPSQGQCRYKNSEPLRDTATIITTSPKLLQVGAIPSQGKCRLVNEELQGSSPNWWQGVQSTTGKPTTGTTCHLNADNEDGYNSTHCHHENDGAIQRKTIKRYYNDRNIPKSGRGSTIEGSYAQMVAATAAVAASNVQTIVSLTGPKRWISLEKQWKWN